MSCFTQRFCLIKVSPHRKTIFYVLFLLWFPICAIFIDFYFWPKPTSFWFVSWTFQEIDCGKYQHLPRTLSEAGLNSLYFEHHSFIMDCPFGLVLRNLWWFLTHVLLQLFNHFEQSLLWHFWIFEYFEFSEDSLFDYNWDNQQMKRTKCSIFRKRYKTLIEKTMTQEKVIHVSFTTQSFYL